MTVDTIILAVLALLTGWALGYTYCIIRSSKAARKRREELDQIRPFADYDTTNPINCKPVREDGDVWVSEFGTEWHRVRPL